MSNLVLERAPLTLKLRDVLRTAGIRCEIGRPPAPDEGDDAPKVPYVVIYPMDGGLGFFGPPLASPESMGEVMFQLTSVGLTGVQAEAVADRVRSTLLGRNGSGGYLNSLDAAPSSPFAGLKVISRSSVGTGSLDADATMVNLHERYTFGCCAA